MCPMRFILVFFSAILAGYMAWRTVRSTADADKDDTTVVAKQTNPVKIMQNGFWVLVDMASGKYLWNNLRDINRTDQVDDSLFITSSG
ncbi:hypothetical protein AgCh_010757 [Apium graveolens]